MKLILFALVLLSPIWIAVIAYAPLQCSWRWSESGLEYKFRPLKGCMVKVGSGFVPEDAVSLQR